MKYGLLIAPNQDTWNVVQGLTQGFIDFQAPIRNARELNDGVASGEVNIPRTEVVVVFDNASRFPLSQDGLTNRLAYTIRNLISPTEPGRKPIPVVIARSDPSDRTLAASLLEEVRYAFAADDVSDAPIADIVTCDATAHQVRAAVALAAGISVPDTDVPLARSGESEKKAPHEATVVTFCGSKGGIGRTTLSHSFGFVAAYAAQCAGYELGVVVIEWDLQRSKVVNIVSFDDNYTPDLLDYRAANGKNEETITENLATASCIDQYGNRLVPKGGMRFLLGPHDPFRASSVAPTEIAEIVEVLVHIPSVDLVIIDCGPEVINNTHVTEAVKIADTVFLVADTDPQSLADIDGSIEWLSSRAGVDVNGDNFHFLINRCQSDIQDAWFLNTIAQSTSATPTACVPRSPKIELAVSESRATDRFLRILDDPQGRRKAKNGTVLSVLKRLVAATVPRPTRKVEK